MRASVTTILILISFEFRGSSESGAKATRTPNAVAPAGRLRTSPSVWTAARSPPLSPGWARATVFVNGTPGTSSIVNITVPMPTATTLTNLTRLTNGAFQFAFTNVPGAVFGVLASTNVALPLSNWTAPGGVTEISPGQFQFTDPQTATNTQRFYRLRVP